MSNQKKPISNEQALITKFKETYHTFLFSMYNEKIVTESQMQAFQQTLIKLLKKVNGDLRSLSLNTLDFEKRNKLDALDHALNADILDT